MFTMKSHTTRYLLVIIMASFILSACGEARTDVEYLDRAKDHKEKGEFQASIIELKNALNVNPDNIEVRMNLGQIYVDMGLGPAAEKELRRAMELGLDAQAVNVPLARALLMQGKFDEVLALATGPAAIDKDQAAVLSALQGHAYLGLANPEEARKAYLGAQALQPDEPEAYLGLARLSVLNRDFDNARQLVDKAIEAGPELSTVWSLSGDIARYQGDVERAESDYSQAVARNKWGTIDLSKRALILIVLEKYDAAAEDIAALHRMAKGSPVPSYVEGIMLFQKGQYREAQTAFEKALVSNDKFMQAVFYLGMTHYLQGAYEQAYSQLAQYAAQNPTHVTAQQMLAILELRQGKHASARRRISPMLLLMPDDIMTLKIMSQIALAEGNTAEAISYMRQVTAVEPDSPFSQSRLGMALMVAGEVEQGSIALKKAVELDSEFKYAEFAMVMSYLTQKKYQEAQAAVKELVAKYPDSPMMLNLMGVVQLESGQVDEARTTFEQVLEKMPGEPGASHNLAGMARKAGDNERAIALYKETLKHYPGHRDTVLSLGSLLFSLQRNEEAQQVFEDAIKVHPDELGPRLFLARFYMQGNMPEKALDILQPIQEKYPDDRMMLLVTGEARIGTGEYNRAIQVLNHLVEVTPNSAEAYYLLVRAHEALGNRDEMAKNLDRVLQLNPAHFEARLAKVGQLVEQGKEQEAVTLLKMLEYSYPKVPEVYLEKARVALHYKRPEEAIAAYDTALSLAPRSDVIIKRGLVYMQAGQGDTAISTLKEWLEKHPDDWLVHYNLSVFYRLLGKDTEARDSMLEVVRLKPDHALALNSLAWSYRETDPRQARAYAERALKQAPGSPDIQDTLGMILLDSGDVKQALKLLETAAEQRPADPAINYHLAMGLARNGEQERAKRLLNRVLSEKQPFHERAAAEKLLKELGD